MKCRPRETTHSPRVSQLPWRITQPLDAQIFTVSARRAPKATAPTARVAEDPCVVVPGDVVCARCS